MFDAMPPGPETPKDPGTFMLAVGRPWITAADLRPIVRGLPPVNLALLARDASHAIDQGLMQARQDLRPLGHLDSAAIAWVEEVAKAADHLIGVFAKCPLDLGRAAGADRSALSLAWAAAARLSQFMDQAQIDALRRSTPKVDLGPHNNWASAVQALADLSRQVVEERRPRLRKVRPERLANKLFIELLVHHFAARWPGETKRAAAFPSQVFDLARLRITARLDDGRELVAVLQPSAKSSAALARKGVRFGPLMDKPSATRGKKTRL